MSYKANVYNVMLASPSDVIEELKIAREVVLEWNNIHSISKKIVLLPIDWEYNSYSSFGDRPQEILNQQILKNADLLVGIFWTRIGTPTGKAISGTVEEIEEHIKSGKPTMLYFSNRQINPDKIDDEQYKAVINLKTEYQKKGLTYSFESSDHFRSQFQRQLPMLINNTDYFSGFEEYPLDSVTDVEPESKKIDLSPEAKLLLIEASMDRHGQIMKLHFTNGFAIRTNNKNLNKDNSPRLKAKWDSVFGELISNDLIKEVGYKGEIFELTAKGYGLADFLKT
ncbi:MAG: hypothetical protein Q7T72_03135 [Bacteroidales bacterium]|nr:hypothetical protein [Bacteroidales bacterium]MDP3002561.1 hypothetical protein [Bacteroidales bacterium]